MVSELYNPLLDWGEGLRPSRSKLPDTLMGTAGAWTEEEDRTLVDHSSSTWTDLGGVSPSICRIVTSRNAASGTTAC